MPMTKRLGAYADITAAFNAALEHGGGTLTFDTTGAARNWRQRAYYYRQLLGPNVRPEYDALQLHHEDCTVKISTVELKAKFTAPNGKKVKVTVDAEAPRQETPVDPLLADALALAKTVKE